MRGGRLQSYRKLEHNVGKLTNDGKLPMDKCVSECPTLRDAMQGIQWLRVKSEVHAAMPELAPFPRGTK